MTHPNAIWMAGEQALARKDFRAAERSYRQALTIDATHAPALIGLSTVLTQLGRHREAHEAAMAAFRSRPPVAPILYAIAQRLRYFHEFDGLVRCLQNPAFVLDAPADIIAQAAVMLSSIGAHDEATALVEEGLRRRPSDAACLHVRGNFHYFRGEAEAAEACYEASLRSDPLLFQNSMMLAGVRPATPERNDVERFGAQLQRARPGGIGEIYLSFALHKQYHELGRFGEAWQSLQRGCVATRLKVNYSTDQDAALVDTLEHLCDAAFVGQTCDVPQPATPIFIVGMHRSGTTLLERMLAGHSQVADAGETYSFHAEMELATDHSCPKGPDIALVERSRSADFQRVATGYARRAEWMRRGKPYFTEKLPHNFLNIGFIAKALPQARFLHVQRDPMDTCFSNLRQFFSGVALYSYDQAELAAFYLLYRRMMAHWHSVLPGQVLDISYQALVNDPAATARAIAAFCGFEFEATMVDISRTSGSLATPSAATARAGFQQDRGQVWSHYEAHLAPLIEGLAPAYTELPAA